MQDRLDGFNTDNGIRRATISFLSIAFFLLFVVSIPTTVSGGLQSTRARRAEEARREVSIPTTVSGGLQFDKAMEMSKELLKFQYRQRYQEGYNTVRTVRLSWFRSQFQYRQRYQEGYNDYILTVIKVHDRVSIPTTVSGGLQYLSSLSLTHKQPPFQYRQRYQEGYNGVYDYARQYLWCRFNTDNGIRRATIGVSAA